MKPIDTIDGLVAALGGPKALGERLSLSQFAVAMWTYRGFIPPAWHVRLTIMCHREGLPIDTRKLFDFDSAELAAIRQEHPAA